MLVLPTSGRRSSTRDVPQVGALRATSRLVACLAAVSRKMLVLLTCIALAVAFGVTVVAYRSAARAGRDALDRLPIGTDGIIIGAQPIELRRNADDPAVLLLHGGGDTPQTLRYLAAFLHERGYAVRVPLLPGHGRTVHAFARADADEWLAAARAQLRDLEERHPWVGLAGLSMGGALAAQIAAATPTLPALGLLAPYLAMPRSVVLAATLAPLWGVAVPYVRALDPNGPRSIYDPQEAARNLAYGVFTPAALRALRLTVTRAFAALPAIASPTLMIQSREDNRIRPADGERAFERIGAQEKQLVWVEGAGHVITVDYGRERTFELLTGWFDAHRTAAASHTRRA